MSFVMKMEVPPGQYRARFSSWEESEHEEYGPRAYFEWEILDGNFAGQKIGRYTSAKLTPKTALGKLAAGIAGRTIQPGETFDPQRFVGATYTLLVELTDSGASRVAACVPVAPELPAATAAAIATGFPVAPPAAVPAAAPPAPPAAFPAASSVPF